MKVNSKTYSKIYDRFSLIFSILTVALIFRAYLVPNTVFVSFERCLDVQTLHYGLPNVFDAASLVCLLATVVWIRYNPLQSKDGNRVGLWLTCGAWLAVISITTIISHSNEALIARNTEFLLAYICGLGAARLFRQVSGYITILICCGAIQSIIAILYQVKGINTLVSGNVIRAGGTFNTPSILYLIPLFILPFAIQRVISSNNTKISAFYMLCSASMFAALVLTWERTGFAAISLGLFWLVWRSITGKMKVISFALVLILICGVFFVRSNGPINRASSMRSIDSRSYLFHAGVLTFTHHLANGVGIGNLTLPVPVTMHNETKLIHMTQPYNQFLFWLDEMGIFGGVLIVLFSIFIYKTVSNSSLNSADALTAVWISVGIASLFNTIFGSYEFSCGNMLIGSLLGITMRMGNENEALVIPPDSFNSIQDNLVHVG